MKPFTPSRGPWMAYTGRPCPDHVSRGTRALQLTSLTEYVLRTGDIGCQTTRFEWQGRMMWIRRELRLLPSREQTI